MEADHAKIEVTTKLPPHTKMKGVQSFLGHAGFDRRFIKDFSKNSKPLYSLLEHNRIFDFTEECLHAFKTLKQALVTSPILSRLDCSLPFELMCNASNSVVGAVLGREITR